MHLTNYIFNTPRSYHRSLYLYQYVSFKNSYTRKMIRCMLEIVILKVQRKIHSTAGCYGVSNKDAFLKRSRFVCKVTVVYYQEILRTRNARIELTLWPLSATFMGLENTYISYICIIHSLSLHRRSYSYVGVIDPNLC